MDGKPKSTQPSRPLIGLAGPRLDDARPFDYDKGGISSGDKSAQSRLPPPPPTPPELCWLTPKSALQHRNFAMPFVYDRGDSSGSAKSAQSRLPPPPPPAFRWPNSDVARPFVYDRGGSAKFQASTDGETSETVRRGNHDINYSDYQGDHIPADDSSDREEVEQL